MIQRIQTVYLFLAVILVIAGTVFPFAHCFVGQEFYTITYHGIESSGTSEVDCSGLWAVAGTVANVVATLMLLRTIFAYKNRIVQMKWCIYTILMLILYYILMGVQVWMLNDATGVFPDLGLIAELPLIAIILIFLAGRAIKRDEDMVRAADRIR